jgi:hypothetical protein
MKDGRRGLQVADTEKLERDRTRGGVMKMDLERGRCGQRRGGNGQCYPNFAIFCSVTLGKSLNLSESLSLIRNRKTESMGTLCKIPHVKLLHTGLTSLSLLQRKKHRQ